MEIPTVFRHENDQDTHTLAFLEKSKIPIPYVKQNELIKILTNRKILFEIVHGSVYLDLKSLVLNVFINDDIDVIDTIINKDIYRTFVREYFMLILAYRYSNLNTIQFVNLKKILKSYITLMDINYTTRIIYFIAERTDDNVEILHFELEQKRYNSIDALSECSKIAKKCGNVKMVRYLNDKITELG
jgi:hypothetical protein